MVRIFFLKYFQAEEQQIDNILLGRNAKAKNLNIQKVCKTIAIFVIYSYASQI
ncbi:MAG: hypothetical protein Q8S54_03300 [Bacteroidota bacterium]|nr:hypothetical protein [Bacteroidota bacterium]